MHDLVRSSISEIGLEPGAIANDSSLVDIGLDSLMTVLLISKLEEKLEKNLALDNFTQDKFETIDSIVTFIQGGAQ